MLTNLQCYFKLSLNSRPTQPSIPRGSLQE